MLWLQKNYSFGNMPFANMSFATFPMQTCSNGTNRKKISTFKTYS